MSRAIPANISNHINAGEVFPIYLFNLKMVGFIAASTNWGLDGGTDPYATPSNFHWATNTIPSGFANTLWTGTGGIYSKDMIASISDISEELDIKDGGALGLISEMSIVLNQVIESESDTFWYFILENGYNLENRIVTAYLMLHSSLDSQTDPSTFSDVLQLWQGKITQFDYDPVHFRIRANADYNPASYLNTVINEDTDSLFNTGNTARDGWKFAKQVEDLRGYKIQDLITASMIQNDDVIDKPALLTYGEIPYAKGYLLNKRPYEGLYTTGQQIHFNNLGTLYAFNTLYVYDSGLDLYFEIITTDEGSADLTTGFFEFDNASQTYADDGVVLSSFRIKCNGIPATSNDGEDIYKSFDDSLSTYAFLDSTNNYPNQRYIRFYLPKITTAYQTEVIAGYLWAKIDTDSTAMPADGSRFYIQLLTTGSSDDILFDSTGFAETFDSITDTDSLEFNFSNQDLNDLFTYGGTTPTEILIRQSPASGASSMPQLNVYEIGVDSRFTIDMLKADFYADIDGIEAPSTDFHDETSGTLLELPQDIARHIIEYVKGDKEKTLEELQKIAEQSHCVIFQNYLGEWKMKPLSASTEICTITTADIRVDENGTPEIEHWLSPLNEIYNEFEINYAYDYGKKKFTKQLYLRDDGTSTVTSGGGNWETNSKTSISSYITICENSYLDNNGWKQKKIIDADWIQDETTAINLLKALVTYFARRVHYFRFSTKNDFTIGASNYSLQLELADQIKINWSGLFPSAINNSSKFLIFKIDTVTNDGFDCYQKFTIRELKT